MPRRVDRLRACDATDAVSRRASRLARCADRPALCADAASCSRIDAAAAHLAHAAVARGDRRAAWLTLRRFDAGATIGRRWRRSTRSPAPRRRSGCRPALWRCAGAASRGERLAVARRARCVRPAAHPQSRHLDAAQAPTHAVRAKLATGRHPPPSRTPCALPGTPLADVRAGIDACVHCGFCLQACPTYVNLEDENDCPRGRIVLMRSVLEGTLAPDDADVQQHIDRCLGCRACETACPSGVPYGQLLEATRATIAAAPAGAAASRASILGVFARPALLARDVLGVPRAARHGLPRLLGRALPRAARLRHGDARVHARRRCARREYTPARRRRARHGRAARRLRDGGLFAHTNDATRAHARGERLHA